jgi:hypothetical protein
MNIVIFIAADIDPKALRDACSEFLMEFEAKEPITWTRKNDEVKTFTITLAGKSPLVIHCVRNIPHFQELCASSPTVSAILCLGTLTDAISQAMNQLVSGSQEGVICPLNKGPGLLQAAQTFLEAQIQQWLKSAASAPAEILKHAEAPCKVFHEAPEQAELRAALIGYITRQRNRLQDVALAEPYVCSPKDIITWAKCQLKLNVTKAFHNHLVVKMGSFQNDGSKLDLSPLSNTLSEMATGIRSLELKAQMLIPSGLMTSNPGSGREAMEARQLLLMKIALLEAILMVLYQSQAIIPLDESVLGRCQQQVNKTIQQSTLYQIQKILKPEGALIQAHWENIGANLAKKMKPHFATYPQILTEAEALQTLGVPSEMSSETHESWLKCLLKEASAQEEVPLFTTEADLQARREPFAPTEILQRVLNKQESIFALLHEQRDKRTQGETRLIAGFRFLEQMMLQKKLNCAPLPADYAPILAPAVVITKALALDDKNERKKYLARHHLSLVQHPQFQEALRLEALAVLRKQYTRYLALDDRDSDEPELIRMKQKAITCAEKQVEKPSPQFSIQALIYQMLTKSDPTYGCLHEARRHDDHGEPAIIRALLKLKAICAKPGRIVVNNLGNIEIAPPPPSLKAKMGGLFSRSEPVSTVEDCDEYKLLTDDDFTI